jgi:hypothetical protein
MAIRHELKYNIIREALGEYLNNTNALPLYNKKQIKEEAYKLEDLEKNKAFLVDKIKRQNLTIDFNLDFSCLYNIIDYFLRQNADAYDLGTCVILNNRKKTSEQCRVFLKNIDEADNATGKMTRLIMDMLRHPNMILNTKDKKELTKIVKNIPENITS